MKKLTLLLVVVSAMAFPTFATTYWVDARNGKDSNNGLARECAEGDVGPKKTLAAVAALAQSNGDVIYALPGSYDEGLMPPYSTEATSNRVILAAGVTLESTHGAKQTFIVGASSPTPTSRGCGPCAVRCAFLSANSTIKGFTITGGRTSQTNASTGDDGGAVSGSDANASAKICDCIVSNNVSRRAGAMLASTAYRCWFANNGVTQLAATFNNANAYNSVIESDFGSYTVWGGSFYNCTFYNSDNNNALVRNGNATLSTRFYNCIILRGSFATAGGTQVAELKGCLLANGIADVYVDPSKSNNCISASAEAIGLNSFAMPCATSPSIDAGDNSLLNRFVTTDGDFYGNGRTQNVTVDIGAVERTPGLTVFGENGGATVSVEGLWTSNVTGFVSASSTPNPDARVTISADPDADSEMAWLEMNGETYGFLECIGGVSRALSELGAYSDAYVHYGWFVSPDGDDENSGRSLKSAFATLEGAVTNRQIVSGTTVYVMPGTYNTGSMTLSANDPYTGKVRNTASRVVVPAGVTLQAVGPQADTRIVGARSPNPIDARTGVGEGAISCAYLYSSAKLVGFTLEGGAVHATGTDEGDLGGGVMGGTIVDCIVTNCSSTRGAAAYTTAYRCLFTDNKASGLVLCANKVTAYDCIFADNSIGCVNANAYVTMNTTTYNCTLLPQPGSILICSHFFQTGMVGGDSTNWVRQSVLLCRAKAGMYYSQCLFASDERSDPDECYNKALTAEQLGAGSQLLTTAEIGVNRTTGVIKRPRRAAVDFADLTWYTASDRATDFFGRPRVQNGLIDCGAAEFDWENWKGESGCVISFK